MSIFEISFIATLLITRVGVFFFVLWLDKIGKPRPETEFFGIRIHHYIYGIILMLIAIAIKSPILLGVGLALFVDELPFILMQGETHEDNYSITANIGVIIFGVLVMIFDQEILNLFF